MLRVMTLNLNYYVTKHGPWSVRKELIRDAIQSESPDIIALQAVRKDPSIQGSLDQARQLSELLPEYTHTLFQPAARYRDGSEEGSALLARIPIAESDTLPLTLLPDLDDSNPRVLIHARFDLSGGTLHLFNAHFSWVTEQAQMNLDEALSYAQSFSGLALLVGDLNTPSDSELLDWLRQAGWTDAWKELHPNEPGFTFESGGPTLRIDYAWANGALRPYLQAIQIVANTQNESGAHPSDHAGLLVTFSLEP